MSLMTISTVEGLQHNFGLLQQIGADGDFLMTISKQGPYALQLGPYL